MYTVNALLKILNKTLHHNDYIHNDNSFYLNLTKFHDRYIRRVSTIKLTADTLPENRRSSV